MKIDVEHLTLDGIDLSELDGEQKESVLELVKLVCSDLLRISTRKFDVGIHMHRLYEISGHGAFEKLRKRFFPDISKRSLQRYTAVGRTFGPHREVVMDIGFNNLGKLAEQDNLSSLRTELIDKVRRGEVVDSHYYKAKISELRKEDDVETEEKADAVIITNAQNPETKLKEGKRKNDVKSEDIDDDTKTLVERLIPVDPVGLRQLWKVLHADRKKQQIANYLYKRVGDLVHNMTP